MEKEAIVPKQAVTLLVMFLIGSSLIVGGPTEAKRDAWLAALMSGALALPMYFVYARILALFPQKDFLDILRFLLGRIAGGALYFLYILFALYLGGLVVRNFTEFLQVAVLQETPQYAFGIAMIATCIYAVRSGIEVIGRWTAFVLPILLAVIVITLLLATQQVEVNYLRPVLQTPFPVLFASAYDFFAFPFGEAVVFLMLFDTLKDRKKTFRIFVVSLIVGIVLFILVLLRNLAVMGIANIEYSVFPSYSAVSVIEVGDIIQRIEVVVSTVFLLCGMLKVSACLLAAGRGTARLLRLEPEKSTAAPLGIFMLLISLVVYKNTMEMFEFLPIWSYFAFPFQVFFPLVIWITAEIRLKRERRQAAPKSGAPQEHA